MRELKGKDPKGDPTKKAIQELLELKKKYKEVAGEVGVELIEDLVRDHFRSALIFVPEELVWKLASTRKYVNLSSQLLCLGVQGRFATCCRSAFWIVVVGGARPLQPAREAGIVGE